MGFLRQLFFLVSVRNINNKYRYIPDLGSVAQVDASFGRVVGLCNITISWDGLKG